MMTSRMESADMSGKNRAVNQAGIPAAGNEVGITQRWKLCLLAGLSLGLVLCVCAGPSDPVTVAAEEAEAVVEPVDFALEVLPILSNNCFACHGQDAENRAADLRLDVAEEAHKLRDGQAPFVPGKPEESLAWQRILSTDPDEVMPPPDSHRTLTEDQKETLRRWILQGAEYREHWAFSPLTKPAVPESEYRNPIDAFLEQQRKARKLQANPVADRRTLIRRVTLDLTGLPPTVEEVRRFVNDPASDAEAYEKLVDELFTRPSHGEQMARGWLDLARYADTHGLHLDNIRTMWPYRDWVVQAFHKNLPFDEFTRWQLAGDLLPEPSREQLIASGFNRCNVTTSEGGSIQEEWVYRYAVDRTTTMAEVWMGLTAGCAVCHDHKFDPLSAREFYSLYAFFHSAADPPMDGNKPDTPPILKLHSEEDKARIGDLQARYEATRGELKTALDQFDYNDPATQDPLPEPAETESLWFEDGFPEGVKPQSNGEPLRLITADMGPVLSGDKALQRTADGLAQDFFSGGAEFVIPEDGTIFVHCFLDPENTPETVMIQFHTDGWKHRAVWGAEEKIPYGKTGTTEKVHLGALPASGEWARLEVKASQLGLKPGDKVVGYAFTQFAGTVTWDRLGILSRVDKVKNPVWSFTAWQGENQGKRNNDLPDGLRELVRGKKPEEWTEDEANDVFRFWLENFHAGLPENVQQLKTRQTTLKQDLDKAEQDVPFTMVMADLPKPRESFVMLRGAYDQPGEKVSRAVPAFLPPLPTREEGEPDFNRLDLANWLLSEEHPLTARVTVNRFWQTFFGTGLVKTSADFGLQGEPPSHPELLDWLAVDFMQNGWDMRRLIKQIVTSEAYRQSTRVTPEVLERDPENRYLARGPRLRLDAEVLRDQALFVGGLLVDRLGGPGVHPYQPPNIWEPVAFGGSNTRFYKQGSGEDLYRRSLYTFLKRTAPPPFMSTFDAPNREQSCTVRDRTNTPMQALQLLNDIQYFEAARGFAQRMFAEAGSTPAERIAWGHEVVTSREPTADELKTLTTLLEDYHSRYRNDKEAAQKVISYGESPPAKELDPAELAAYTLIANLLLNLDETINTN